jgi:hypothetical protein
MSRRSAANTGAAKAAPALSLSLTKREAKALLELVDYAFREEERHFYCERPEDRARHIFHAVGIVAIAVGYTTKAHLRMLEQQDAEYRATEAD